MVFLEKLVNNVLPLTQDLFDMNGEYPPTNQMKEDRFEKARKASKAVIKRAFMVMSAQSQKCQLID